MIYKKEINFKYDYDYVLSRVTFDPLFNVENKVISFILDNELVKVSYKESSFFIDTNCDPRYIQHIENMFGINVNLKDIAKRYSNTKLSPLVEMYEGTPIVLDISPEIALYRTIFHQQISMKGAYNITKQFLDLYGTKIHDHYVFPSTDKIASLTIDDLRNAKLTRSKSQYMINIAKAIQYDEISINSFNNMSNSEIHSQLIKISGIGDWSINCVLLLGLGRTNLFLKSDLGLINGVKRYFNLSEKPNKKYLKELEKDLPEYKSFITFYFWRYVTF